MPVPGLSRSPLSSRSLPSLRASSAATGGTEDDTSSRALWQREAIVRSANVPWVLLWNEASSQVTSEQVITLSWS